MENPTFTKTEKANGAYFRSNELSETMPPKVTEVLVTAQELSSEERGKTNLIYLETPCGFHIALDRTYIDQVGDFIIKLPTGEVIDTSDY